MYSLYRFSSGSCLLTHPGLISVKDKHCEVLKRGLSSFLHNDVLIDTCITGTLLFNVTAKEVKNFTHSVGPEAGRVPNTPTRLEK